MPDTKVIVITPIAPHNLNVRPLVLPETAKVDIAFESRDGVATLSTDNQTMEIDQDWSIHVEMAQFSLKRIPPNPGCSPGTHGPGPSRGGCR